MNKLLIGVILIAVIAFIGFMISTISIPELPEEDTGEYVTLAQEWIYENSSTFIERGGMNLEHTRTVEIEEGVYEIVFDYEASYAGYGPKGDELAATVITPHTVVVIIKDGEVVSVITDGVYNEITQEEVEEEVFIAFVYFVVVEDGQESVVSVERTFGEPSYENVIRELLTGPTEEEKEEGFSTAIQEGTSLQSISLEEDRVVVVDFSEELNNIAGSAMVMAARSQIEKTLLQFEEIKEIVISVNGETEDVLQP